MKFSIVQSMACLLCFVFTGQVAICDGCYRYTPSPCPVAPPGCGDVPCTPSVGSIEYPQLLKPVVAYTCPDHSAGAYDIAVQRIIAACYTVNPPNGMGYPGIGLIEQIYICHRYRYCSGEPCTPNTLPTMGTYSYIDKPPFNSQAVPPTVTIYNAYCGEGVQTGTATTNNYYDCTGTERSCPL